MGLIRFFRSIINDSLDARGFPTDGGSVQTEKDKVREHNAQHAPGALRISTHMCNDLMIGYVLECWDFHPFTLYGDYARREWVRQMSFHTLDAAEAEVARRRAKALRAAEIRAYVPEVVRVYDPIP